MALKAHRPLILLALLIQDIEYPLRAGKGGDEEVRLLRELVDRGSRLAHEDKVACKASHIGPAPKHHQATDKGHYRIVYI